MRPLKVPLNVWLVVSLLALMLAACDMFIPVPMPAPSPIRPTPLPTRTATPLPTATRLPTATPSSTPFRTPTQSACDRAALVADVTFPPGALVAPGTTFTKTWRIRNASPCTWTPNYSLVMVNGDNLGAPLSTRIPYLVIPGMEFNLSVELFAPCASGHYFNNFMLRDDKAADFGVNGTATVPFLVLIAVAGKPAKNACPNRSP